MSSKKLKPEEVKQKEPDKNKNVQGELKCDQCGNVFEKKCALTSHKNFHNPIIYECNVCGYTSKQKSWYDTHMARHDKERALAMEIEKELQNGSFDMAMGGPCKNTRRVAQMKRLSLQRSQSGETSSAMEQEKATAKPQVSAISQLSGGDPRNGPSTSDCGRPRKAGPTVERSEEPVDERMESPDMSEQSSTVPSSPCPVTTEADSTMMDISESSGMPENPFDNSMASPVANTSSILPDDPSAEPIIQYDFDEPSPHFGSVDPSPQLSEAEPLQLPSPAPEKKAFRHPAKGRCLRLKTRKEIFRDISVHNEMRLELNEKRKELLGIQDDNRYLDGETLFTAHYKKTLGRAPTSKINEGKDQNRSESSIDSDSDAELKSPVQNVTHKRHLKPISDVDEATHVDRMKNKRTRMETFHDGASTSAQQVNIVRTIFPVVQTLQLEGTSDLEKQAEPVDVVEKMNEVPETSVEAEDETLVTPEPEAEETTAEEERQLLDGPDEPVPELSKVPDEAIAQNS